MDPKSAELTTAICAGPPGVVPAKACATLMSHVPAPLFSKNAPKMRKIITNVADTPMGMEKIPSSVRNSCSTTSSYEKRKPCKSPDSSCPQSMYATNSAAMSDRGRPTMRRPPSSSRTTRSVPKTSWAVVNGSICWMRVVMSP